MFSAYLLSFFCFSFEIGVADVGRSLGSSSIQFIYIDLQELCVFTFPHPKIELCLFSPPFPGPGGFIGIILVSGVFNNKMFN